MLFDLHRFLRHWPTVVLSCTLAAGALAQKIDLTRNKPVAENEPIPTADFFRAPVLHEPKINPDGTYIAALVTTTQNNFGLITYDLATQKVETISVDDNQDIYYFGWLGSSRLFYFISTERLYGIGVFGVNLNNFYHSYPLLQYKGAYIIGIPPQNPTFPLVWAHFDAIDNGRDEGVVELNSNVQSGRAVNLHSSAAGWNDLVDADQSNQRHIRAHYPVVPGSGEGYATSRDGKLAFGISSEKGIYSLYQLEDDRWIKSALDLDKVEFLSTGNAPDDVLINGPRQEGKPRALQWANAKTGELGEVLHQDDSYDFNGRIYRNPVTEKVVGLQYERNGPHNTWFADDYQALQKTLDGFFPGQVVRLVDEDNHSNVFLVAVYSDRQPTIYYFVNLGTKRVGLIKSTQPWVDPKRMQAMNIIKYKTRDGHKLDAYLTLPAGATKQNPPPLIVLPHGGPWVRDSWGFNNEVQFLASRGYAVLQPNYRGSTDYDWMFPEKDRWDFRKMHDDVTDAAKMVIASGYIDPNRVAIMGGSFGGYLSLSGAVNEPNLYKCAVTIAGVFDWGKLIKEKKSDQFTSTEYAHLLRRLGDPDKQKAKFDAISPLRHVDQVHIPVFVAHGTEDPRVDVSESKTLISELEKNHIPHESMIVRGEGHGMHHVESEVELYDRIDAFLSKYLSPKNPATASSSLSTEANQVATMSH